MWPFHSKSKSSAPQPDATNHDSIISRASHSIGRLVLHQSTRPLELGSDANFTRFYELEGDPNEAERAAKARYSRRITVPNTYPRAESTSHDPPQLIDRPSRPIKARKQLPPAPARAVSRTTISPYRADAATKQPTKMPVLAREPQSISKHLEPHVSEHNKDPPRDAQLARVIASVTHLLREMYSLDLKIFGTQNTQSQDQIERNEMIERADLIFQKIKTTLDNWEAQKGRWTESELAMLRNICRTAKRHSPKRIRTPYGSN